MIASKGAEVIHLCPAEQLNPAEPLPNGTGGRKLEGLPKGASVLLEKGWFCAVIPGKAHMVGGKIFDKSGSGDKWAVKVPCADEFAVSK